MSEPVEIRAAVAALACDILDGTAATEADKVWLARCIQKIVNEWLADHEDRLGKQDEQPQPPKAEGGDV